MTVLEGQTAYVLGDWWVGNAVDDVGVLWRVIRDSGWVNPPKKRTSRTPRPSQDGSHGAPAPWDERLVSLEGKCVAPDRVARDEAKDRLSALFATTQTLRLTVAEHHMTRWADVELDADSIDIVELTPNIFEFAIDLVATDPLKYGLVTPLSTGLPVPDAVGTGLEYGALDELEYGAGDELDYAGEQDGRVGGTLFIPNPGTVPFWAPFRIQGPVPNPRVAAPATGASLQFATTLGDGQFIDVRGRERTVLLNGTSDARTLTSYVGDWLAIPPGGVELQLSGDEYHPDTRLIVLAPEGAWI